MDRNDVTKTVMKNSMSKKMSVTTDKGASSNIWRYVSIGGTMGIVMLANASPATIENIMSNLNETFSSDSSTDDAVSTVSGSSAAMPADISSDALIAGESSTDDAASIVSDTPVASAASDSSDSFADAFAAARSELGAGGVFEWRGNLYNTYYQEEWEAMSDNERDLFCDNAMANREYLSADDVAVDVTGDLLDEEHTSNMFNIDDAVDDDAELEDIDDDADFADISMHDELSEIVDDADEQLSGNEITVLDDESDVYVIGANGNNADTDWSSEIYSDGISVIDTDGDGTYDVAIVAADMDGDGELSPNEIYALGDVDGDNFYDIAAYDVNGDGELSLNETFDISDAGLAYEDGQLSAPVGFESPADDFSFDDNALFVEM